MGSLLSCETAEAAIVLQFQGAVVFRGESVCSCCAACSKVASLYYTPGTVPTRNNPRIPPPQYVSERNLGYRRLISLPCEHDKMASNQLP